VGDKLSLLLDKLLAFFVSLNKSSVGLFPGLAFLTALVTLTFLMQTSWLFNLMARPKLS
jgi:hypothetical protein